MTPVEIRAMRKNLGLSMEKAAIKVGVSLQTWWRWEAGRSKPSQLAIEVLKQMKEGSR